MKSDCESRDRCVVEMEGWGRGGKTYILKEMEFREEEKYKKIIRCKNI